MTTDDELIEKMWMAFNHAPNPQMRAVLTVVREHDGRDAERPEMSFVDGYERQNAILQQELSIAAAINASLRADLAALRAENEALRDDCSRLASYNAEESAHLRTRAEKAEADLAALRAAQN